jgi:hypothetical protein
MPKNSSVEVLRRWRAMDAALAIDDARLGLHVPTFAREWNVNERTVRRDLAAFRDLGQEMICNDLGEEEGRRCWWYARGVLPLFVENLRR